MLLLSVSSVSVALANKATLRWHLLHHLVITWYLVECELWSQLCLIRHPGLKAQVVLICNKTKLFRILAKTKSRKSVSSRIAICLCAQTREAQELQRQAQDLDTQLKELKKAASKHQQQGAVIKRTCNSQQAALDALNMRRADLLAAAAMEQVRFLFCADCLDQHWCLLSCHLSNTNDVSMPVWLTLCILGVETAECVSSCTRRL